ncbi:MAG: cbb3-type cytochrome c oxidase subunit I [Acidimicrobiia bacterium]
MAAGERPDSAATRHVFTSTAFLAVGAVLWLASLVAMRFPNLFPISAGRLRPMAMIALLLGWLVLGLSAGIYYLLPRLTGSPLRAEGLANLSLVAAVGAFLAGMVLVGLGLGDGREPFAIPWWWDIPVLAVLCVPLLVTWRSLRHRRENTIYPSIWFAVAGVTWLPGLYIVGNLPRLRSLGMTLGDMVFGAGFLHVWAVGICTGLAYYVVPKVSGMPLASRQLARVGFWSLLFGAVWMGPAQLVGGPAPEWLPGIASVLGLALPVAMIANATNIALTIGPEWKNIGRKPVMAAAVGGAVLAALVGILSALASFRSASLLVAFTMFWEGIIHLMVFGAVILLFAAFAWQAIPNLVGRSVDSEARASALVRRIPLMAGGTTLFLALAGLASGYGWAGAAYSGLVDNIGEGWKQTAGLPGVFTGLALLIGLFGLMAQLGLCLSIYRSLTSGRATEQEVLVFGESVGS